MDAEPAESNMQVRFAQRLTRAGADNAAAAAGASFYTFGLLTALRHPEWAQAYWHSMPANEHIVRAADLVVLDIPASVRDGD